MSSSSAATSTSERRGPRRASGAFAALALLAALAAAVAPAALAAEGRKDGRPEPVERSFLLRFRKTDDAALLIRPFLSQEGSLTIRARANRITVRDSAPVVERCAQLIAELDVPPRAVSISLTLLKAGNVPAGGPSGGPTVSEQIRGVGESLKKLFNFTAYTPLDALVIQGTEGDSVAYTIGGEYRIGFLLEPTADTSIVRLKDLVLERLRRDAQGKETRHEILHTSLNAPLGKTNVLGIGKDEAARGALFLVFAASLKPGPGPGIAPAPWLSPGPGIAGVH